MVNIQNQFDFSLIIACYNEEPHLVDSVCTLSKYLAATRLSFEMIFVEDCSRDGTVAKVLECEQLLKERGIPVKTIFHQVNQGRGATVQDGFLVASGAIIGYIDIDLEHRPDALLSMLLKLQAGECDAIVAKRTSDLGSVNFGRYIASESYKLIAHRFLKLPVSDSEAGLKLFNREKLLPVLAHVKDKAWFWDTEVVYMAAKHGLRFCEHPIVFVKNPKKASTVRFFRDSYIYFKSIWRFAKKEKWIASQKR